MGNLHTTRSLPTFSGDEIDQLVRRIHVCMRALTAQDHEDDDALLQDLVTRLLRWKKDVTIETRSFTVYREKSPHMAKLLRELVDGIDGVVQQLDTTITMEDFESSPGPTYVCCLFSAILFHISQLRLTPILPFA